MGGGWLFTQCENYSIDSRSSSFRVEERRLPAAFASAMVSRLMAEEIAIRSFARDL
jgi:hypothetical protein